MLLDEILRQAAGNVPLQKALVAGAMMEGGSLEGPWPPGDNGWSRGPFQIKYWSPGRHPTFNGHPLTIEQAEDPKTAVAYAITGLEYWKHSDQYPNDPIRVAFLSERPAHMYNLEQQLKAWKKIHEIFGGTVMVEKPEIIQVGAHPANFIEGRGDIKLEAVVWHVTEGGMPGPWFNDPRARASTNYGVSKSGRIEQYVSLDDTAFAQGSVEVAYENARPLIRDNWGINPNTWAASIEFEGTTADVKAGRVPTPEQEEAATRLTAWLFQDVLLRSGASGVAVDREHILMHRDISPNSRTCPVWDETVQGRMIAKVQSLLTPETKPDPQPLTLEGLNKRIDDLLKEAERIAYEVSELKKHLRGV